MGFSEIRVELQGHLRCCFAFRKRFLPRQIAVPSEQHVGIGQTSVGECVAVVFLDRLLKVLDRLVETFFGPPVPVVTTFEVEPVRRCILRMTFCQSLLFCSS